MKDRTSNLAEGAGVPALAFGQETGKRREPDGAVPALARAPLPRAPLLGVRVFCCPFLMGLSFVCLSSE
jgi:hypothetical protein